MNERVLAWDPHAVDAEAQLLAVLALHRANRSRLGPMPDSAFRQRSRHGGLLLTEVDGQVVGYVLYDLPRSAIIKLVHVCVSASGRRAGLARAMVEFAVAANPRRSQITAACRADYGVDGLWQALGMHVASTRAGRAFGGSVLMIWTKRINVEEGLDLLESASLESGLPIAVLDTNVVNDLFAPAEIQRAHREESVQLASDWVDPLVSFVVSGEVDTEISHNPDERSRDLVWSASQYLTRISTLRPANRIIENELLSRTDPLLLAADPSLGMDILQVADAVNAGADYFVTNDGNVLFAAAAWDLSRYGIRVLRPHEVLTALSPESFMTDFRSHLIDGGDLEWIEVSQWEPEFEPAFRVYENEEKPNLFVQRVRELLAKPKTTRLRKLVDGDGRLWALVASERDGDLVRFPLLRAIRGIRGRTIAYQLLRDCRRRAWKAGASRIEVTEPSLSATLEEALTADGFSSEDPRVVALGPDTMLASESEASSAEQVVRTERSRWPLVVLGAALPTYLIPIQPEWAESLLGLNDGLLSFRRRGLGLSRELVYFSGARTVPRDLPARILWYVTAGKTTATRQIVARSTLIDSARLRADDARERFSGRGVLRGSEIERAADKAGRVTVLRFEDTELLRRPISRHDEVYKRYVKGRVFSMQHVEPAMFDAIVALQADAVSSS